MRSAPTKRQIQAKETKHKLYENAIKLFDEKGYSSVTIEEICALSNLSKGTFYVHFNSKHDIVITQSKQTDEAQRTFYNAMDKTLSYSQQLILFMEFICANIQKDKGIDTERAIYAAELDKANQPGYIINEARPIYSIFREIYEKGQAADEFRNDITIEEAVEICICCIRGVLYEWMITVSQKNRNPADMCRRLAEVMIFGLKQE